MRYHNITKDDMLNGTGLRVVLWVAGCLHACKDCHNPVTWDVKGGLLFDEAAKVELFAELAKSHVEGITLSGGDPLHPIHREEIGRLMAEIKTGFPDKNIWLYTGYSWDDISALPYIKLVDTLVDGKFERDLRDPNLFWRGSSNQKVIDVKKTIDMNQIVELTLNF